MKCKYFVPGMQSLKDLCKHFYTLEGCGAGGPLHILLDDNNYDTDSIIFCMKECYKGIQAFNMGKEADYQRCVYILGLEICDRYLRMPIEYRAVFDCYWCGYDLNDCCGDCKQCHIFDDDLYDFMLEKEATDDA